MNLELGQKIKELRVLKELTLKDLSEKTGLSISFISQVERGLSTITITSLQNIADVLGESLTYFLSSPKKQEKMIIRSYEQEVFQVKDSKYVYYSLAGDMPDKIFDPMIAVLLPGQTRDEVLPYPHKGQEFGYVLEGILTFIIGDKEYELYPGDSLHIPSMTPHNWANFTNKIVKVLYIITPKVFN